MTATANCNNGSYSYWQILPATVDLGSNVLPSQTILVPYIQTVPNTTEPVPFISYPPTYTPSFPPYEPYVTPNIPFEPYPLLTSEEFSEKLKKLIADSHLSSEMLKLLGLPVPQTEPISNEKSPEDKKDTPPIPLMVAKRGRILDLEWD